ncbi:hypothetical protein GQ43DRAFT_491470 [Delitschia confertaspora ATCC 74209]|uniref:Uncharacterized protein n=1 Tax=Delitschia confertaspora ATCC 74209 TaxID=1513339 RepID=A0A9P4JJL9_9PLEO|nr:hypothetical protein GQ43DRAFT_491470 [Delitschia confertaspora ATCC 74209]
MSGICHDHHQEWLCNQYCLPYRIRDVIASICRENVKGTSWTLVLQPHLPSWARKGDPNPVDLEGLDEPLVVMEFTLSRFESRHNEVVEKLTRGAMEQIDALPR